MQDQSAKSVRVRDARSEDIAAMVRFNCALAQESEGKALDQQTVLRGVQRGMASPSVCRYFVAEVDGQVVGQTMLTFELTDWRDGMIYWIQSVYVEPEWRGRGVFRTIFQYIERIAAEDPAGRCIRLYVERENTAGIATYRKLGMNEENYLIFEKSVAR